MAFPTVLDVTTTPITASGTSHVIVMPATIVAGQLLLSHVLSAQTKTPSAGWSLVGTTASTNVYARSASGGDTLTITTATADQVMALTYRVSGWSGTVSDIKHAAAAGTLNPPSLSMPAVADHLWLAGCRNTFSAPTVPASYANLTTASGGGVYLAIASRARAILTEDPATFGGTASGANAYTVGIAPVAGLSPAAFLPFFSP